MTLSAEERPALGAVLAELSSARVPWLAVVAAGAARRDRAVRTRSDATVIDLADPHASPVMVNPFEPEAGYPVQAHADRLAGLLEAAFGPPGPVAAAVRLGLRRTYADCGWDVVTGAAPPGTRTVPAVPAFGQLARAAMGAAEDLGYDRRMRAAVSGFVHARLEPLWTGPAGRFLEDGHPAEVGALVRGNVLVLADGAADERGTSFLVGVLLTRVAERLYLGARRERMAVVTTADLIPAAAAGPGAAHWFARLLADLCSAGAEVIAAGDPHELEPAGPEPRAGRKAAACAPVLRGRRSVACGTQCRQDRPCSGYELHAATLVARDDQQAWLRLWAQTLLLAFVTGRPLPRVPAEVFSGWRALGRRTRECVLATVLDRAVADRAAALRPCYDPAGLTAVVAAVARRMLDEAGAPFRAGPVWVIPQLRWLHEIERLNPLGGQIRPDEIAPPLDFGLAGLPDWPGIRIRDRLYALGRHPLSMASARNRRLACLALLGEAGRPRLDADLAAAILGVPPAARLAHAARLMDTGVQEAGAGEADAGEAGAGEAGAGEAGAWEAEPGWLEVVLSWPDRISRPSWDTDPGLPGAATG